MGLGAALTPFGSMLLLCSRRLRRALNCDPVMPRHANPLYSYTPNRCINSSLAPILVNRPELLLCRAEFYITITNITTAREASWEP